MFLIALGNVLITLLYAAPGFALCKAKKSIGGSPFYIVRRPRVYLRPMHDNKFLS